MPVYIELANLIVPKPVIEKKYAGVQINSGLITALMEIITIKKMIFCFQFLG